MKFRLNLILRNESDKKFVKQNIWNNVNSVTALVTLLREFN